MSDRTLKMSYPPRRRPHVIEDHRPAPPWMTHSRLQIHANVTAVSPKRDRRFTANVTD